MTRNLEKPKTIKRLSKRNWSFIFNPKEFSSNNRELTISNFFLKESRHLNIGNIAAAEINDSKIQILEPRWQSGLIQGNNKVIF